jgi:hypothetical protein
MKRWWIVPAVLGLALLASQPVLAQSDDDEDDENAPYNYALGVGVGLVEAVETEDYLTASLRIRVGRDDDEGGGGRRDRGIGGYIEPEIGYWESSVDNFEGSDLLLGVNLVGAFPFSRAESFVGVGVGVHFIDAALLENNVALDDSETKLGANAQFGIDLRLSRSLSAFGTGRFDLVQGSSENVQTKIYLGLRARL